MLKILNSELLLCIIIGLVLAYSTMMWITE